MNRCVTRRCAGDHQKVVMRVVEALQSRGYEMWVDVQDMSGSTVDASECTKHSKFCLAFLSSAQAIIHWFSHRVALVAVALAVEGASVMLVCVSRAYKESSNCRLEANYGLQREVSMVPLMMEEDYKPDGWLGLLLGTRMWYPLYGETVLRPTVFEERMVALSRDLGTRGQMVTAASKTTVAVAEPAVVIVAARGRPQVALRSELAVMKMSALRKRAATTGMSEEEVDAAGDTAGLSPQTGTIRFCCGLQG